MKNQEDTIIYKIIFSVFICLWGLYIIKIYNIDLTQTLIEKIDGHEQAKGLIYMSDDFLNKLLKHNHLDFYRYALHICGKSNPLFIIKAL